jgi:hypothetical protein
LEICPPESLNAPSSDPPFQENPALEHSSYSGFLGAVREGWKLQRRLPLLQRKHDRIQFETAFSVALFLLIVVATGNSQVPKQSVSGAIRPHRRMPLTDFYNTPNPLPPAPLGSLIRAEQFADYALAPEIAATRFLYHSRSSNGGDVATSGVVLVPDRKAPRGGWPIIAWAHSFEGIARQCAPSLLENLGEGSYFAMYTKLGYAVVATDYVGLGTEFPSVYLNLRSNAMDVVGAVQASRSAVSQLGPKWVAMGEGEGGVVAAAVAETEGEIQDPNFLGSISLGGLTDSENIANRWIHVDPARMIYLAHGIKSAFPQFDPSGILTSQAMAYYEEATSSCDTFGASPLISATLVLKQGWERNSFVKQYFESNTLGLKSTSRPIYVLISDSNSPIPVAMTEQAIRRLCRQGDYVLFEKLKSPDSKTIIGDSVSDQIAWIQARFSNQAAVSNCK